MTSRDKFSLFGLAILLRCSRYFLHGGLAVLVAQGGFAWASDASSPSLPTGVWHGTVGKESVRVCVNEPEKSQSSYIYWVQRQRVSEHLSFESTRDGVTLGVGQSIKWQLRPQTKSTPKKTVWVGEWREETDTNKWVVHPIQLTWQEPLQPEGKSRWTTCGPALLAPFIKAQSVRQEAAQWQGMAYTRLINRYGETMALPLPADGTPDAQKAITRVNQQLLKKLHEQWETVFFCAAGNSMTGEEKGAEIEKKSDFKLVPVAWSQNWLAVRISEDFRYCGGAHGDYHLDHAVFDLQTGTAVKPERWLRGLSSYGFVTEDSALARVLSKFAKREMFSNQRIAYANPKGFVFSLSQGGPCRVDIGLCTKEVVVPYALLKRHATSEGKKVINDWMQKAEQPDTPASSTEGVDPLEAPSIR